MSGEAKDSEPTSIIELVGDPHLANVLKEAAENWAANDNYAIELKEWVSSNADIFTEYVADREREHKLEFCSLHGEYLALFEKQIESYVRADTDYNIGEFFKECKNALDGYMCAIFEEHEEKWFVEAMVSATDYNEWFSMMVDAAELNKGGNRK